MEVPGQDLHQGAAVGQEEGEHVAAAVRVDQHVHRLHTRHELGVIVGGAVGQRHAVHAPVRRRQGNGSDGSGRQRGEQRDVCEVGRKEEGMNPFSDRHSLSTHLNFVPAGGTHFLHSCE